MGGAICRRSALLHPQKYEVTVEANVTGSPLSPLSSTSPTTRKREITGESSALVFDDLVERIRGGNLNVREICTRMEDIFRSESVERVEHITKLLKVFYSEVKLTTPRSPVNPGNRKGQNYNSACPPPIADKITSIFEMILFALRWPEV